MNWLIPYNLFEARANPVYQEKVKKARYSVKKSTPNGKTIMSLIYEEFFTEELNNFLTKYLLLQIEFNKHSPGSSTKVDSEGNVASNISVCSFSKADRCYTDNFYGLARLFSDFITGKQSIELPEEDITDKFIDIKGLKVNRHFFMDINIQEHVCRVNLEFYFQVGPIQGVRVNYMNDVVIKDITKKDVIDFTRKSLKEAYIQALISIEDFKSRFTIYENKMVKYLKDEINKPGLHFKLIGALKHYPELMNLLKLDSSNINSASDMGEMGF